MEEDIKYHDILMSPQALWLNHINGNIELPIDAMREEIERPLRLQIDVLKNMLANYFELHDDAGTAYIYLGPSPEWIDEVVAQNPQDCYAQVVNETLDLCARVVDENNAMRILKLKGD